MNRTPFICDISITQMERKTMKNTGAAHVVFALKVPSTYLPNPHTYLSSFGMAPDHAVSIQTLETICLGF